MSQPVSRHRSLTGNAACCPLGLLLACCSPSGVAPTTTSALDSGVAPTTASELESGTLSDTALPLVEAAVAPGCTVTELKTVLVLESQGMQRSELTESVHPLVRDLEGTVVERGTGFPAKAGPTPTSLQGPGKADAAYLRIQVADRDWTVVTNAISDFGLAVGAPVEAHLEYRPLGGWAPNPIAVRLTSRGALVFHYAAAGSASDLAAPPGWRIEQDSELCVTRTDCGKWANYRMNVSAPDGRQVSVTPGDTQPLGEYLVTATSTQAPPGQSPSPCSDWDPRKSQLSIQRQD